MGLDAMRSNWKEDSIRELSVLGHLFPVSKCVT